MNGNQTDRVLDVLDPPAGGWQRLRARRDAVEPHPMVWLGFVAGIGAAGLAAVIVVQLSGISLTLPPSAARLEGRLIADTPPRLPDAGTVSTLPAAEGVRVYWAEPAAR